MEENPSANLSVATTSGADLDLKAPEVSSVDPGLPVVKQELETSAKPKHTETKPKSGVARTVSSPADPSVNTSTRSAEERDRRQSGITYFSAKIVPTGNPLTGLISSSPNVLKGNSTVI